MKGDAIIAVAVCGVIGVSAIADAFTSTYKPAPDPAPIVDTSAAEIADLQADLAAREAELDALANTLASAVAELNEAAAVLRAHGITPPIEP